VSGAGLSVRIGGLDAPIFAVARGLIAVQVPFEAATGSSVAIDVSQNGSPINSISVPVIESNVGLFNTGDTDNGWGLPQLAALNEDGTVNSFSNPAADGSIVSIFGTGMGVVFPGLPTGVLSPVPPSGELSVTQQYGVAIGCQPGYMGSAPGLSTAVFQANVRLINVEIGTGSRPHPIGLALTSQLPIMPIATTSGVIYVK
jgi:uncharacterized protein (TIGR03437 family)